LKVTGNPDETHVSTSFAERQNLTMRMHMRRFTRLTNAFSKKVENLKHSVALHFMHYNFVKVHQTLRVTPAMQAGVADHVWTLEELAELLSRKEHFMSLDRDSQNRMTIFKFFKDRRWSATEKEFNEFDCGKTHLATYMDGLIDRKLIESKNGTYKVTEAGERELANLESLLGEDCSN